MTSRNLPPASQRPHVLDEAAALRSVVEGTASETGESFFASLVENLRRALGTMGAWVATLDESKGELRALTMRLRNDRFDGYTYQVEGTPCETALHDRSLLHIPERIVELYHGNPHLESYAPVSYLGVPLLASDGRIIGQLAVLDDKPMPSEPRGMAIFQIFANRAAAELERLQAERVIHEREEQLRLLLDSALDAILDFDAEFRIALMNPAAQSSFGRASSSLGLDVRELFSPESRLRLERCAAELLAPSIERSSAWIAGGLTAGSGLIEPFQAEATLSHYRRAEQDRFTLILRNVEERVAAERRIVSLTREAEYLREALKSFQSDDRIVGSSRALLSALHELEQVADTETSVLLLGETGTGKELFARALHARSKRARQPLVKVNCGAIPHNLIESELFGHEKGAFTGATQRRDGRFMLAHGGTLFLDEIGELPLELQPKLLRVLQEGELERVGSSRTVSVDVRIVAATNRNLAECVERGTFREDLFYRLNVFPIRIPPLRERGRDVDELARVFLEKYARRAGPELAPLSEAALGKLRAYSWPGNVRELQNVIERGVIVSRSGVFDIDRALPGLAPPAPPAMPPETEPRVRTAKELTELERRNIELALAQTSGKVAGDEGAAALLGMHPSTLNSRIRTLRIKRRR